MGLKRSHSLIDMDDVVEATPEFQPSFVFDEGDVEFIITPKYTIRIDSAILRSASRFFATSLSAAWANQSEGGLNDSFGVRSVRWTFVLELDEDNPDGDIFKRQSLAQTARLTTPQTTQIRGRTYFKAIENLFAVFCHRDLQTTGFDDCTALVRLADKYDCLPCVSRAVRLQMTELPTVWQDIAEKPVEYFVLAEKIRSSMILKEAAVHVIGRWGELSGKIHGQIPSDRYEVLGFWSECLLTRTEEIKSELLLLENTPPKPEIMSDKWIALAVMRECIIQAYQRYGNIADRNLYNQLLNAGKLNEHNLDKVGRGWSTHGIRKALKALRQLVKDILGEIAVVRTHPSVDVAGLNYLLSSDLEEFEPWREDSP